MDDWNSRREHRMTANRSAVIESGPQESREAAQLVIANYGEPDECTTSILIWNTPGQWKRIVASRCFFDHQFPMPHTDSVQSFIGYRVPPEKLTELGRFDGSVTVDRTAGEVSARCHDGQANFLALNLMNDIVAGDRSADDARKYYAHEFLNVRRKEPTPYMERLRFETGDNSADADEPFASWSARHRQLLPKLAVCARIEPPDRVYTSPHDPGLIPSSAPRRPADA
jgi:hypothetical protein